MSDIKRGLKIVESTKETVTLRPTVHFCCHGCGKSVTNELPGDAQLRAIAWCPECIEAGRDQDRPVFTREDVQLLRGIAEDYEHRGLPDPHPFDQLNAFAARIEALLPRDKQ